MDAQVYPHDSVGDYFNSRFVSVKVQMDKTKNDNDQVKSWYNDAAALNQQHKIEGYPSYLFFSPTGTIVHAGTGAILDITKFIALAQTATIPGKVYVDPYAEYYKLVAEYKKGQINYDSLLYMTWKSNNLKDTILRNEFQSKHIEYMKTLSPERRYSKKNISFWSYYFKPDIKSPIFQFYYRDSRLIDKVMEQQYYAAKEIDKAIQKDIVIPFYIAQSKNPNISFRGYYAGGDNLSSFYDEADWSKLEKMLRQKYNKEVTRRAVLNARIEWYKRHRNYKAIGNYSLLIIKAFPKKKYTYDDSRIINDYGWYTFLFGTNKDTINEAIIWIGKFVKQNPKLTPLIDTYASLLYKAGRKDEAIFWEEKAVAIAPKDEGLAYTLERMKKGEKWEGVVWQ
jgi:tetratricopeptide (TPR) repeat protein